MPLENPIKAKLILSFVIGGIALVAYLFSSMPLLNLIALPFLTAGLFVITRVASCNLWIGHIAWLFSLLFGFFVAIYRPGGFNYPLIWETSGLYPGGGAYLLFCNISKAAGGYLVFIWLLGSCSVSTLNQATRPLLNSLLIAAAGVLTVLAVATTFFNIGWAPKLSEGILYFSAVNLLVTVMAEEAFFRLLIQDRINALFSNKRLGTGVGIAIVSLVFALSHTASIGPMFFLFLIAGVVYASVYSVTGRFSMALTAHFGVNVLHFIFLEYPIFK